MKLIKEITDKEILGTDGLSAAKPRYTARAIVKNKDNKYAVMYSHKFNFHSLPGGGIDEGEDIVSALKREILEETGCLCADIKELGYVSENRFHCDYTQISYYFVVETSDSTPQMQLTEVEIINQTEMQWHTLKDMITLISSPVHDTKQRKFLQARDIAAINEYLRIQDKQINCNKNIFQEA